MIALIDAYLQGDIGSFQFDERHRALTMQTSDSTVRFVSLKLWYFYDDVTDHTVRLDREQWNIIQRLRLLLASRYHYREVTTWQFHGLQFVAVACLLCVGLMVWSGSPWVGVLAVCGAGPASMILEWFRRGLAPERVYDRECSPFRSVDDVWRAYESADHFQRHQYPGSHESSSSRKTPAILLVLGQAVTWIGLGLAWIAGAPIVLLFQSLPIRRTNVVLDKFAMADPGLLNHEGKTRVGKSRP